MRFASALTFLVGSAALFSSASAYHVAPVDHLRGVTRTTLTSRALEVPVCLTLEVNLDLRNALTALTGDNPGGLLNTLLSGVLGLVDNLLDLLNLNLDLGELCLCATTTALTPDTLANINLIAGIEDTSTLLGQVSEVVNDLAAFLEPLLFNIVSNNLPAAQCSYPDGAIPLSNGATCGSACDFTCPAGQERDGDDCITTGSLRASAASNGKRTLKQRSRYACLQHLMTACPVSDFLAHGQVVAGFECIDTRTNLESCGGCISPFPGNAAGQDCTAIPKAYSVGCHAGRCVVDSCAQGFAPSADATSCEAL